jgi:hypothetical protein
MLKKFVKLIIFFTRGGMFLILNSSPIPPPPPPLHVATLAKIFTAAPLKTTKIMCNILFIFVIIKLLNKLIVFLRKDNFRK